MRATWICSALFFCACGPASFPEPTIVSVTPERVAQGIPSSLSVQVNAVLPISVDYDNRSVDPSQLQITMRLAGKQVDVPFIDQDSTLVVPVPEGLSLGSYDVRLTLADGREAVREQAFSVVPAPTLDGPDSEDPADASGNHIWGFHVDYIGDQTRNVPFKVTIRAEGRGAKDFQDHIFLRASRGMVTPFTQGSFSTGVRVEEISLNYTEHPIYLLVEDTHGHKGLSNSFRVRPK